MKNNNTTIKYINYNRKSREDKNAQILSLTSQKEWCEEIRKQRHLLVSEVLEEAKSAKTPYKRDQFDYLVRQLKGNKAQGIICWKLDRLARNPEEAGIILGMLKRGEIQHIITNEREYRPEDNSIISYVDFSMADQFTRDLGKNVKRGLDKKIELGWRSGNVPLGYLNSKTKLKGEQDIHNDPERFSIVKQTLHTMLTGNYSVPKLLEIVNNQLGLLTIATRRYPSRKIHLTHLYGILSNPFYYGWFPWRNADTGLIEWKKGKHEAIITPEEFDRIQFLIGRKGRPRPKTHKFAFTGLMRCSCGGTITCEEKFKKQKNGNTHHYIYYHCGRKINPDCVEKSVELKSFNKQVDEILEKMTISEKFKSWAIKYLHEIGKKEAETFQTVLENKQKRLGQITEQMTNLALLFTSPDNRDHVMLSPEEYSRTKQPLMKEQIALEHDIQSQGEETRNWVELTEKTFNFACYARMWFAQGDLETKRAIFACIGSDLMLKDQKVLLNIHKPLQFIFENAKSAEKEISRVEPPKTVANKEEKDIFDQKIPLLCGIAESNRSPQFGKLLFYR